MVEKLLIGKYKITPRKAYEPMGRFFVLDNVLVFFIAVVFI